jgi:ABC-type maltose transport system permease subunit
MAGALFSGVPVAALFTLFLDDFVEGVTGGSIK